MGCPISPNPPGPSTRRAAHVKHQTRLAPGSRGISPGGCKSVNSAPSNSAPELQTPDVILAWELPDTIVQLKLKESRKHLSRRDLPVQLLQQLLQEKSFVHAQ